MSLQKMDDLVKKLPAGTSVRAFWEKGFHIQACILASGSGSYRERNSFYPEVAGQNQRRMMAIT